MGDSVRPSAKKRNAKKQNGCLRRPYKQLRVKKAGLKLNIQKTKIMASSPIASWKTEKKWKQ